MLFGVFTISLAGRIAFKAIQKLKVDQKMMGFRSLMLKYPGGFEEKMTPKEAAKILNIR